MTDQNKQAAKAWAAAVRSMKGEDKRRAVALITWRGICAVWQMFPRVFFFVMLTMMWVITDSKHWIGVLEEPVRLERWVEFFRIILSLSLFVAILFTLPCALVAAAIELQRLIVDRLPAHGVATEVEEGNN